MRVYALKKVELEMKRRSEGESNLCNAFNGTSDRKHTFVNACDDLAYASFYTGLLTKIRNIFATFTDDDASVFSTYKSTEC